ncbi:hypothetical protein XNA1_3090014 [Xenorhabdus nematophila str. Anatoliense]|nr:hypothetical protein XNA1_3090014 [Xenorhabdus nematophila str. Anatoliense]
MVAQPPPHGLLAEQVGRADGQVSAASGKVIILLFVNSFSLLANCAYHISSC